MEEMRWMRQDGNGDGGYEGVGSNSIRRKISDVRHAKKESFFPSHVDFIPTTKEIPLCGKKEKPVLRFLDASSHHHNMLCPLVGRLVGQSVTHS